MTLKEKLTDKNLKIRHSTSELYYEDKLEQIADDYAIEFVEWVEDFNKVPTGDFTTKELLEIFKKQIRYDSSRMVNGRNYL